MNAIDAGTTAVVPEQREALHQWWTLGAVSIAIFMLLLDITVVNVALPDIQRSLHSSFANLQWVVDAYALMLAAALLAAGSLADMFGRRRIFVAGLVVFIVASIACGLAGSPLTLNLSRGVQGVGGAMMFSTALALIANAFTGKERATAFGVFGAVTGLSIAIGPLVGGVITEGLGWEWIFFVNVPIGIGAIVMTMLRVTESKDPHVHGIDWAGAFTFSAALFLVVLSLIKANDWGWLSARIIAQFTIAFLLLVAFVWIELKRSHPLFDLELFKNPSFIGASIVAVAISASVFSLFLYLTLYLQNFLEYSPLEAGIRFLPTSLLSFAVAPIAGRMTAFVPMRYFLSGGLALIAVGCWLMTGLTVESEWTALLPGFIVSGIGVGMVNPPLASAAIAVVPAARAGMGSGINSTFRQIGIATGIAGLGAIFHAQVIDNTTRLLAGTPVAAHADAIAQSVSSGSVRNAVNALPSANHEVVINAAHHAFLSGFNSILLVGAIIAGVGAVLAAMLVKI